MPNMHADVNPRDILLSIFDAIKPDKIYFDILHADLRVFGFMTDSSL